MKKTYDNGYRYLFYRWYESYYGCSANRHVFPWRIRIDSKKVCVEFSLADMDMSSCQQGVTYEQTKAYVLEKYGLKMSSHYISQVKWKYGGTKL